MIKGKEKLRCTMVCPPLLLLLITLSSFETASCRTPRQVAQNPTAIEQIRGLRFVTSAQESTLARVETENPGTPAAGLARIARARMAFNSRNYPYTATLLNSDLVHNTAIGDHALYLLATAHEMSNKEEDARAGYEKLVRLYPASIYVRKSLLKIAEISLKSGEVSRVPSILQPLIKVDDSTAHLLSARAYERSGDTDKAISSYRRIYFFQPQSAESSEASAAILRLRSNTTPASREEGITRSTRLFNSKRYQMAFDSFTQVFSLYADLNTNENRINHAISGLNAGRYREVINQLSSIQSFSNEHKPQALALVAESYGKLDQWEVARQKINDLRTSYPNSRALLSSLIGLGQRAKERERVSEHRYFISLAHDLFKGDPQLATPQFDLAWEEHKDENYQVSSRMLVDHLAYYADRNNENRGMAGYWAARDLERVGKLAEARYIYSAMQNRYGATWYGYLSKLRLDSIGRDSGSQLNRNEDLANAARNLSIVNYPKDEPVSLQDPALRRVDELKTVGLDDYAIEELKVLSDGRPSLRVNRLLANIYRDRTDNLSALITLSKSYPDYSQMEPQELEVSDWSIFYPLNYWDIIVQESRAKRLDPKVVAGLIRQESIFNPKVRSSANAYGLMQLILPTGRLVARKYGYASQITPEALYEPRLNIQLGTAYMRDQFDRFGRLEYVSAAYNAGPHRVVQWRETLPLEIDEWAEDIPFRETRGYVKGVMRNKLQYMRLYDDNGKFRSLVGSSPLNPSNR
jgi:soluble lytic murein transglycosylase